MSSADSITINHKDSRWVGAWWVGFIITGSVMLLAGIPFWFLPKSLPKQGQKKSKGKEGGEASTEQEALMKKNDQPVSMVAMAKGKMHRDTSKLISSWRSLAASFHKHTHTFTHTYNPTHIHRSYVK